MNSVSDHGAAPGDAPPVTSAPTRRRLVLAGAVLAALVIASGAAFWRGGGPPPPGIAIGGPFTLIDGQGHQVTDRDLRGKFLLVYFGYTFCPDACPTTLTQVADAMDRLGPRAERLQPVFITVDPQRDTPAVIGRYAAAFSPHLLGLTGSLAQIAAVAREYHVYYAAHGDGSDYTVDHSSLLYLMGPDGKFLALMPADQGGPTLAEDIARHLS